MKPAPRHLAYHGGDADEQLLCFGPEDAPRRILIIPPLFDEMNRVRHTLVEAMRALAELGVASALPDLPGCNESTAKLGRQSLTLWRAAMVGACDGFGATHILSVRGGCLIDDCKPALPITRLATVKGNSLLNMLMRVRIAGDKEGGITTTTDDLTKAAREGLVELGGNPISSAMWDELIAAQPAEMANAKDVKPADIDGAALWLRAEPQHSADMAAGLAKLLYTWSAPA